MTIHLVTGATGHIGNVLVRTLLASGLHVRALVRGGSNLESLNDLAVEIFQGDILQLESLKSAMQGVDVVHHLAAKISLQDPDPESEQVNLAGTIHVLEAARQAGVRRLLYTSSIYALKIPSEGIVDERLPFDPESAQGSYDRSKAAATLEVLKAAQEGLDAVIICPTAVTGPFDFHNSETGRGIRYNLGSGIRFTVEGAYDFVDVRDTAQGMLQAVSKGRRGEAYILGGERLTVEEVAQTIWESNGNWHTGVRLPDWLADLAGFIIPMVQDDPLVTPYSLACVRSNSNISHAKASRELGYKPRPARDAILDAVRWWQGRMEDENLAPVPATG